MKVLCNTGSVSKHPNTAICSRVQLSRSSSPGLNFHPPLPPVPTLNSYRKPTAYSLPSSVEITASMASAASTWSQSKPFSVLFVCLGNICRSPAAEGVFRAIVQKRGLESKFNIDSAGNTNYHQGNLADPRMRDASKRRGIDITSISRPIGPSDFREFDLILAMDRQNKDDVLLAFNRWRNTDGLIADAHKKVRLMCSYCKKHKEAEVPDPYYGGPQGFEKVLDILEDACQSLLDSILAGEYS